MFFWFYTTFKKKALLLNVLETESLRAWPKLYIPRTLNTDLILWHTQLIVSAENENIQTSVHLEVLNSHMLWAKHLIRQCWKHPNICSSGGFKQSCDLGRRSLWIFGETSRHLFIWRFFNNHMLWAEHLTYSIQMSFIIDVLMIMVAKLPCKSAAL